MALIGKNKQQFTKALRAAKQSGKFCESDSRRIKIHWQCQSRQYEWGPVGLANRHHAPTGTPGRDQRGRGRETRPGWWSRSGVSAPSFAKPVLVKLQKPKLSLLFQVLTAIAASASLRWCRRDESSDSSTALSSSLISVWSQNQIFFVMDWLFIISPLDASILSMTVTL